MQIGSVATDDFSQALTLVLSIIGVVLWMRWANTRERKLYAIAPLSYLGHRVVFYVVITLVALPSDQAVIWSSAISLHSVITLVVAALSMLDMAGRA